MFAILAEDYSDAEALSFLVRRRLSNDRLSIKKKGYDGCAALCRKGARDIKTWAGVGVRRVIVCHDSDGNPPGKIRQKVLERIISPSLFAGPSCVTIPVEEIEAWMIADETAINAVIPSFKFKGHSNPEAIRNPKEWLCGQSRASNGRPLYAPRTFNPSVAKKLRFEVVAAKCPSFQAFLTWLDQQR